MTLNRNDVRKETNLKMMLKFINEDKNNIRATIEGIK